MTIFAIDTCSLIALQYSGYLEIIIKNVDILITKKIVSELEEISAIRDDDGRAAGDVLRSLSGLSIMETTPKSSGEEELIEVALQDRCDLKKCESSVPGKRILYTLQEHNYSNSCIKSKLNCLVS